ncbi:MAG: DEAD/DEAH box helicase family protein, partial [Nanoarchaeota archaeon]|nr:DEAD/DEAH box helicase family protein [Nanoarchaeota archaeon]
MQLLFPFDKIRPTQEKMIKDIEIALKNKKHLVAHAPTGTGKSAAALSAALTYAIENGKTILFLTPKHTQHQIAIETLQKIKEKFNVKITATDFIGKKWMCRVPGVDSLTSRDFNEFCAEMRKEERCPFYNNIWKKNKLTNSAKKLIENLKEKSPIHVEELTSIASKEEMCPYYIATELAKDSKVIIADYYHIFHPRVRNAFLLRTKKEFENCIIIVDEAQNLPNRIRSVLSSKISNISINFAIK